MVLLQMQKRYERFIHFVDISRRKAILYNRCIYSLG